MDRCLRPGEVDIGPRLDKSFANETSRRFQVRVYILFGTNAAHSLNNKQLEFDYKKQWSIGNAEIEFQLCSGYNEISDRYFTPKLARGVTWDSQVLNRITETSVLWNSAQQLRD